MWFISNCDGVLCVSVPHTHTHAHTQGVVTGVGENSEFGAVFKMMQNEEVCESVVYSTFLLCE